jgi:hypothetical protein
VCGRTSGSRGSAGSSTAGGCERHDGVCLDGNWAIIEVVDA